MACIHSFFSVPSSNPRIAPPVISYGCHCSSPCTQKHGRPCELFKSNVLICFLRLGNHFNEVHLVGGAADAVARVMVAGSSLFID